MDPVSVDVERSLWDSAFSLVCGIVGSSAGLYALFRLPLMFQLFHPGSFLVALFFCMLLFAWPLSVTELAIGQRFRLAAVPAMDSIVTGGRGIAFTSVVIGSLLTAAYSSSSLAVVVSPVFSDLVEGKSPTGTATTVRTSASGEEDSWRTSEEFLSHGNYYSVIALFCIWVVSAYLSWKFISQASLFSRIMLPLPLILWCVLAIFASSVVTNKDYFRFLLLPNGSFWNGFLWANAAGQALLLLQVGTGVTITFGSKAKSVHSVVNVSFALFGIAILYAFVVTVASAGTMTLNSEANNSSSLSLLPTTNNNNNTNSNNNTTTSSSNNNNNSSNNNNNNTNGRGGKDDELDLGRTGLSAAVLLPALFNEAGDGSSFLGVVIYLVAIIVGVFAITLLLSSFYSSMSDLHVALRSPLTIIVASLVCFAIGAPMAKGAVPSIVIIALDQAVVGTCLPLLVCAESIAIAFGGWEGSPSVLASLGEIGEEDLPWYAKVQTAFELLRGFGVTRLRDLFGADNEDNNDGNGKNVVVGGGGGGGGKGGLHFGKGGKLVGISNKNNSSSSGGSQSNNGSNNTPHGRFIIYLLPFFLKVFIPIASLICAFSTLVYFAQAEGNTTAAEVLYVIVVVLTFFILYLIVAKTAPTPTAKPLPWNDDLVGAHIHEMRENSTISVTGGGGGEGRGPSSSTCSSPELSASRNQDNQNNNNEGQEESEEKGEEGEGEKKNKEEEGKKKNDEFFNLESVIPDSSPPTVVTSPNTSTTAKLVSSSSSSSSAVVGTSNENALYSPTGAEEEGNSVPNATSSGSVTWKE